MTSKAHNKHAKLQKAEGGSFHRNEIAILGAPCSIVNKLAKNLAAALKPKSVAFADAAHQSKEEIDTFNLEITDNISHYAHRFKSDHYEYDRRALLDSADLVLVNGNHFKAEKQWVIINEKKKESLQRKLDRLTHVIGFILDDGQHDIHDYLKESFLDIPVFSLDDLEGILKHTQKQLRMPALKGLVLAGGKSMRMGEDKGKIAYHGKPQREYMLELIDAFCEQRFLSVARKQELNLPQIADRFEGLGPYGGILSAFQHDPNAAWLTVATDIPLLDASTLKLLVEKRNPSKLATCFYNPETDFPEPLITIWEPRAYARMLYFLSMGYSCPRKVLINSDIELIKLSDTAVLDNANTPEEKEAMISRIKA